MQRSIIAGVALALTGSGSALAQSAASGTVAVTATVQATCLINSLTNAGSLGTADFTVSPSATSTILIGAKTVTGNTANCNVPTHITLSSANGASVTGGTITSAATFQNYFDYTAAVTFDTASVTLSTLSNPSTGAAESITSSGVTAVTSGAFAGNLGVTITSLTPAKKLISGSYSDTLTITLTAN